MCVDAVGLCVGWLCDCAGWLCGCVVPLGKLNLNVDLKREWSGGHMVEIMFILTSE